MLNSTKKVTTVLAIFFLAVTIALSPVMTNEASASSTSYTVRSGDTLWLIANRFGVSLTSLRQANNLHSTNLIYPGQTLSLPTSNSGSSTYTVQWGDNLWIIANRFNTSVSQLRQANNIWSNTIYPGQTLTIPGSSNQGSSNQGSSSDSGFRRLNISNYERDLMARAVYSEARGEIYEGQVAVAAVIINRVLDGRWPNNVEGVIFEPWAFTAVHDGQFWLTPNQTAYNAVEDALRGWDPTNGAVFYYNPVTATSQWIFTRTVITHIGKHAFAI